MFINNRNNYLWLYSHPPFILLKVSTEVSKWSNNIPFTPTYLYEFPFPSNIFPLIYSFTFINISSLFFPSYFASSAHLVGCGIFDQGAVYLFGLRSLTRVHWHERVFIVLISAPDCLRRLISLQMLPLKTVASLFSLH